MVDMLDHGAERPADFAMSGDGAEPSVGPVPDKPDEPTGACESADSAAPAPSPSAPSRIVSALASILPDRVSNHMPMLSDTSDPVAASVADEAQDAEEAQARTGKPGNFLTYVQTAHDTFADRPFCTLDSLVFSWMSYYRLNSALRLSHTRGGIALHELMRAEDFDTMFGTNWDPEGSRDLLFAVCSSPRFRDARLCLFAFRTDRDSAEQFAAMTFLLPGGGAFIAFRGTDSTLVGWHEDFNMASRCPVPSQREAHAYVERVASALDGPLYLGGHSKGGNLAVYAASCVDASVQERIVRVYSHDGPGFNEEFLASEGYQRVRERVEKVVPKSSIIGLIMDTERDFTVVESDGISVLQHNPFLWEVDGCAFRVADGLSASSRYFAATISDWMDRFTAEERASFIDTLFDVLSVPGAMRFADIRETWRTSLPAIRDAAEALAPEQRAFVMDVLKALARVATIDRVSDAASNLVETFLPGLGDDSGEGDGEEQRDDSGA